MVLQSRVKNKMLRNKMKYKENPYADGKKFPEPPERGFNPPGQPDDRQKPGGPTRGFNPPRRPFPPKKPMPGFLPSRPTPKRPMPPGRRPMPGPKPPVRPKPGLPILGDDVAVKKCMEMCRQRKQLPNQPRRKLPEQPIRRFNI